MTGREHEAVPGDRAEHGPRLGQHGAVGVDDRHRLELEARRAQLALQLHPDRDPRPRRELRLLAALVDGVDGREPDGARALARGDLDRDGVHPADGAVERDRTEHLDAGDRRAHDRRALRGRGVVRLQLEPAQPELGEAACERHVVDPPRNDVRRDVHVRVERAAQERARALGDGVRSLDAHPASSASTARAAPVTRGRTPSSPSSSAASSSSCTRRAACSRLPRQSRSTRRSSAAARVAPASARNQSSHPAARAAAAPSSRAAARPFMKTERSSFRSAAVPGSGPSTSTLRAERPEQLREPLSARAGGEERRAQAAARHGRHHRHVGEEGGGVLDGHRDVALQLRAAGVEVGIHGAGPQGGRRRARGGPRRLGRRQAEDEVGTANRVRRARRELGAGDLARRPRVEGAHEAAGGDEVARDLRARLADPDDRDSPLDGGLAHGLMRSVRVGDGDGA